MAKAGMNLQIVSKPKSKVLNADRRLFVPLRSPMYFYVPESFDAASVLPQSMRRYVDCANYFVHCIVRGQVLWEADEAGFTRLKVEYLRKVIPDRQERRLRTWLIEAGVIECDMRYEPGVLSRGYRLAEPYQTRFRRVECKDPKVAARIRERVRVAHRTDIRLDVHRHLRRWYERLEIDVEQARAIALGLNHWENHLAMIDMIAGNEIEFSCCAMGRVHTNVTRMARELRPALRIDGQFLCNVDVANSQPLILALLIQDYRATGGRFDRRSFARKRINPYTDVQPLHLKPPHTTTPAGTTPNTMSNGGEAPIGADVITDSGMKTDEHRYIALCERGRLYDFLQERAGLSALTRRQFKEKFYRDVFFGRNQVVTDVTRRFASEFPSVMKLIRQVKRPDHGLLARVMQHIESNLVINGVCRRLMTDYPEVPVITIHDSILTMPPCVELVKEIMLKEFQRVGLYPRLKVERYGVEESQSRAA